MSEPQKVTRLMTPDTVADDLSAKDLVRLMVLEITYSDEGLSAMSDEDRALVLKNSRAKD